MVGSTTFDCSNLWTQKWDILEAWDSGCHMVNICCIIYYVYFYSVYLITFMWFRLWLKVNPLKSWTLIDLLLSWPGQSLSKLLTAKQAESVFCFSGLLVVDPEFFTWNSRDPAGTAVQCRWTTFQCSSQVLHEPLGQTMRLCGTTRPMMAKAQGQISQKDSLGSLRVHILYSSAEGCFTMHRGDFFHKLSNTNQQRQHCW